MLNTEKIIKDIIGKNMKDKYCDCGSKLNKSDYKKMYDMKGNFCGHAVRCSNCNSQIWLSD